MNVDETQTGADSLPASLRWAVWLLVGEAVAVAVVAAFLAYEDFTATATNLGAALVVTAFAAAGAAGLAGLARALSRRRSRARGPAVVLQLMLLPIGYYMTQAGLALLGLPLMALALAVCGLLITPATTRALGLH